MKTKNSKKKKLMKDCRMRQFNNDVIYNTVILILAINSFKIQQNVNFVVFCSSQAVECLIDIKTVLTAILKT